MIMPFIAHARWVALTGILLCMERPSWAANLVDWSHAATIDIAMSNYAFSPKTFTLKAGTPYHLHFVNSSTHGHDFASTELFSALEVAPQDKSKVEDGKVEVDGSQSVTVDVVPISKGTYAVRCTHPLHSMFGMKGQVTVE